MLTKTLIIVCRLSAPAASTERNSRTWNHVYTRVHVPADDDVVFLDLSSPLPVELGDNGARAILSPRSPDVGQLQLPLVAIDYKSGGTNAYDVTNAC